MKIKRMKLNGERVKRLDEFVTRISKLSKPIKIDLDADIFGNKILRLSNGDNFIAVNYKDLKEIVKYFEDVNLEKFEEWDKQ